MVDCQLIRASGALLRLYGGLTERPGNCLQSRLRQFESGIHLVAGSSVTNSDTLDKFATRRVRLAETLSVKVARFQYPVVHPVFLKSQWYNSHMMRRIRENNPLALLFMLESFAYGLGFIILPHVHLGTSSLYVTMTGISPHITLIWGIVLVIVVLVTLAGHRIASLLGCAAWIFALICYGLAGNWIVLVAIALPNVLFWAWQHTH